MRQIVIALMILIPQLAFSKESVPSQKILSLRTGIQTQSLNALPLGIENKSDLSPPLLTVRYDYRQRSEVSFPWEFSVAASWLSGGAAQAYLQVGGWQQFEAFNFHYGFEFFNTMGGGSYKNTLFSHAGHGVYISGDFTWRMLKPSLEFRYRLVQEAKVASKENFSTYVAHDGDYLLRPAVETDLKLLRLWGALTLYRVGNTSIASKDFGIGIGASTLNIFSLGVGRQFGVTDLWIKAHHINGIDDEQAHIYQTPQFYPDYLVGQNSIFLEASWQL